MAESQEVVDDVSFPRSREEQIVYVTSNLRDAEELATMLGYRVTARKRLRPTSRGKATIREFVVGPVHVTYRLERLGTAGDISDK